MRAEIQTVQGLEGTIRTLDETAPTLDAESSLTADQLTATGVWLRWGEASDNGQVVRCELRQDGEVVDGENRRTNSAELVTCLRDRPTPLS